MLSGNEALAAFNAFGFGWGAARENDNDVRRPAHGALYRLNVGVDFIDPSTTNAAPDALLDRLNRFVKDGGHVVYTFKSGFSDEHVEVRATPQPGIIGDACGISYTQFTLPRGVSVTSPYPLQQGSDAVRFWMELLTPTTPRVIARYDHPVWREYAAVTENTYGKGLATYVGFMPSDEMMGRILEDAVRKAGLWGADQDIAFPLITKSGANQQGKTVRYYFNYLGRATTFRYPHGGGRDLLGHRAIEAGSQQQLPPWGG